MELGQGLVPAQAQPGSVGWATQGVCDAPGEVQKAAELGLSVTCGPSTAALAGEDEVVLGALFPLDCRTLNSALFFVVPACQLDLVLSAGVGAASRPTGLYFHLLWHLQPVVPWGVAAAGAEQLCQGCR